MLKCIETGQLYVMADPIKLRRDLIESFGKTIDGNSLKFRFLKGYRRRNQ